MSVDMLLDSENTLYFNVIELKKHYNLTNRWELSFVHSTTINLVVWSFYSTIYIYKYIYRETDRYIKYRAATNKIKLPTWS